MSYFLHNVLDVFFVFSQSEVLMSENGTPEDHRWVQNLFR